MVKNSLGDWAPRARPGLPPERQDSHSCGYSRFYDEWADITQLSQNFGGNWPAVEYHPKQRSERQYPTVTAADPLQFGSGGAIVYPINDFSQVSQWMVDPNFRTPFFDQWNIGIQRELPANDVSMRTMSVRTAGMRTGVRS